MEKWTSFLIFIFWEIVFSINMSVTRVTVRIIRQGLNLQHAPGLTPQTEGSCKSHSPTFDILQAYLWSETNTWKLIQAVKCEYEIPAVFELNFVFIN